MAEYIEREAAIEAIKKERDYIGKFSFEEEPAWTVGFHQGITFALSDVTAIPAADVRPVVRGQNIDYTVDGHCEFKCSVCGVELTSVYGGLNDFGLDGGYFNFCPNCGADMREES